MNQDYSAASALTRACSDLRGLLETVAVRPAVALSALASLLIGKAYVCDKAHRQGTTHDEVWPGSDIPEVVEDVYEALETLSKREIDGDVRGDLNLPVASVLGDGVSKPRDPDVFRRVLDWVRALDLRAIAGRQLAAGAFDEAVRFLVSHDGRSLGQYVTPDPAVDLMLDLAAPVPGESVYDPCFGLGGLLVGAVRRMQTTASTSSSHADVRAAAITGVETKLIPYLVGLCRLVLAGIDHPSLDYDDALEKPLPDTGSETGFDCILAVPPWGEQSLSDYRDKHFPIWSEQSEDLFLQHVMANLRPGGRAVVALPERTLFHADSMALRKTLLSEYRVAGVVGLPGGAFEPFSSIPVSLLMFSRAKPRELVHFVNVSPLAWGSAVDEASDDGEGRGGSAYPGQHFSCGAKLRDFGISEVIQDRREQSSIAWSSGVEVWAIPVDELPLQNYGLVAKRSGSEMLDAMIEEVVAADRALMVETLGDIADVSMGKSDDVGGQGPVEVMTAPQVDFGFYELPDDPVSEELAADHAVRRGDLLVMMDDFAEGMREHGSQYGPNVGLITEDISTDDLVVAWEGTTVVRVRDRIKPEFLAALLRSPVYWFWMFGHASRWTDPTGFEVSFIPAHVLRTLKIPVPSASVQDAVVEEATELGADALGVVSRLLQDVAAHPIAIWLEKPVPARLAAGGTVAASDRLSTLAEVAQGLRSLSVAALPEAGRQSLGAWVAIARRAAGALDDVVSIPPGAGRLAILEFALARFHESLGVLGNAEQPFVERLRLITRAVVEIAEGEVHAMQRTCTLDIHVTPAEVEVGVISEVDLLVINSSPVPLRNVQVRVRQEDGTVDTGDVVFLSDGEERKVPLIVRAKDSAKSVRIAVRWQARRLDGTTVHGEQEVAVLVRSGNDTNEQSELGTSPYIVGNPVDRDDMFFGRVDQMGQIRRQLGGADHANVILLEGNRRTGKTSILRQLGRAGALPGWIPVYCSFQDVDSVATADVFRLLALRTGWTLSEAGIETWIPDQPPPESSKAFKLAFRAALHRAFSDGHPFETLEVYLATAVEAAKPRGILLMLDEFDKLQEGIDGGITSPQVPENIRHLLQHQPGLGAIITGSRRLKRLREEYWSALFGFGYRIGVSALPKAAARRLVTDPVAGRLRYLPQACDWLVELCACHPFLIQSLCSRVFDHAATEGDRTITLDIVERAATEMMQDNEHMQTLWGYVGSERGRLILALCDRLAAGSDAVNISLLRMEFDGCRVPVRRDEDLADEVAKLRELELIEFDTSYRNGTYILSIPLMAKWMTRNVDYDDLVVRARQEAEDAL